mgnify:CR=1 FL=1
MNAACYINRLIRDGLANDFNLQTVKHDGTTDKKEFAEAECQVDENELEKPEDEEPDTTVPDLLKLLKDHAVSLVQRMTPSKRGYQNFVWQDFTFK